MQLGPTLLALSALTPLAPAQEVGLAPGNRLPDLELPLIDGSDTVRLGDLRGKRVLLVVFASW